MSGRYYPLSDVHSLVTYAEKMIKNSIYGSFAIKLQNIEQLLPGPEFDEIDTKIKATGVMLSRAKMSHNKIAVRDIEKTLSALFQERKSFEFWDKLTKDYDKRSVRITW